MTYLHYAAYCNNLEACQILLRKNFNPYLCTGNRSSRSKLFDENKDGVVKYYGPNAIEMFPKMEHLVALWYDKSVMLGQNLYKKTKPYYNVVIVTVDKKNQQQFDPLIMWEQAMAMREAKKKLEREEAEAEKQRKLNMEKLASKSKSKSK